MANIKEVAKLAGVSAATVSRVLNNTANVKEEKRQKVLSAILETGFKTSDETKQLVKKRHKTICVVVSAKKNAFYSQLVSEINKAAFQKGYRILLVTFDENVENELSNPKMLSHVKADGIIITVDDEKIVQVAARCKVPVVVFEQICNVEGSIAYVESDYRNGGRIAMEHMLRCGCKNIVFLKETGVTSSKQARFLGYKDVCKKYGIKEQTIECGCEYEDGCKVVKPLLTKYPHVDGIIANNDEVAWSICKKLKKEGYRVPDDIQVIGFDNVSMSEQVLPELTTIAQPIGEMGTLAVQLILDCLSELPFQKEYVFDVSLVERQTTKRKEIRYEKKGDFE